MKNNFIFKIIENDLSKNRNLKIKTRFAPEPNGYLHLGHIKSIILNYEISKKYNGIFNIRLDDTNPDNENKIYVKNIIKDIRWLNIKINHISYSSDYFFDIYNFAIELIKKGIAYVDELNKIDLKKYKGNYFKKGINSPYRNRSIDENLELFSNMNKGVYNENRFFLRAKINMGSKFFILRDPILYRIKKKEHYKTKDKWNIYPTYDFSHCICDYIEKITHSLCTLEFSNNKLIYEWVLKNININKYKIPKQYEYSKFNINNNLLSKRKIKYLISNKIIKKFNDPRLLTIYSIRKKNIPSIYIINFFKKIDINKNEIITNIELFENYIKKQLDKNNYRLICILSPIKIIILNLNNCYSEIIYIPNNPKIKESGFRKFLFSKYIYIEYLDFIKYFYNFKDNGNKKIIKLRYAYIITLNNIFFNKKNIIIECIYYPNTLNKIFLNNKKVDCIIHWLSVNNTIKNKITIHNNLFKVTNINNIRNIYNKINKNSIYTIYGYLEKNLNILNNNIYQFERIGFFLVKKIKNKMFFSKLIFKLSNNQFI